MYRVLIVDDEKIIRIGLQSIINWGELGFKVVGVVSDGLQALKFMENEQVDVVLTDIKMPNMDGLNLVKTLKETAFSGEIIMLTNYGEFELARGALRYGVHDYLLKATLMPEDLIGTLRTLTKKMKEREYVDAPMRSPANSVIQEDIGHIIKVFQQSLDPSLPALDLGLEGSYRFLLIRRIKSKYENQDKEVKMLSYYEVAINNIVQEIVSLEKEVHIAYDKDWAIYIIPKWQFNEEEEFKQLALQIQNHIRMYTNTKVITVISALFNNTRDLQRFLERSIRATQLVFYRGYGQVILQEEYKELGSSREISQEQLTGKLRGALQKGDYEQAIKIDEAYFDELKMLKIPQEQVDNFLNKVMNELIMEYGIYLDKDKDKLKEIAVKYRKCTTLNEIQSVLRELIYTICSYILQVRDTNYRKEVLDIIEYINQNVAKKITLTSLAEEVNMNESYISRLFKGETGINLINYINMIKMEKAKELLKNPDMMIKDVANELGFEDQSYFNRTFKKYFGLNPKEYKSKCKNSKNYSK